jgi:hypothetical protein
VWVQTRGGNGGALPIGMPKIQGAEKEVTEQGRMGKYECSQSHWGPQNLSAHSEIRGGNRKNDGAMNTEKKGVEWRW